MRQVRWSVFGAHATEDGRPHIAPINRETKIVAAPHVLSEHCPCRPRVTLGLVVHETISDYVVALATRAALLS